MATLLAGKYVGETTMQEKTSRLDVNGAILINIADDPDLIDASGGYNFGCYIKAIDQQTGSMWLNAGLTDGWIIQKLNNEKISNIADLQRCMQQNSQKVILLTAVKNYSSSSFEIFLP